ncbi:tetratricopeptide repeat protein [Candidatus Poribacteria bacterium]|nr:tetratricopeptide repeat protein [Candidatus Poribacteria bacterium]
MNFTHFRTFLCLLLLVFTVPVVGNDLWWDVSTYSVEVQEHLEKAQHAFKEGEFEEALRLYQILVKDLPKLLNAYIGEGDSSAKLGDYPSAIEAFQRALQLISELPQTQRFVLEPTVQAKLASAYHRNNQLDDADALFQQAIRGTGEKAHVSWYIALGQIETERGHFEKARRYYIVAVQLHPDTTAAYNNLGHVLLKLNRIDEADAVFREALTLDKTLASAAFGRGQVAAKRDQFDVARNYYERAIQNNSLEPLFYKALADVLEKLGDTKATEIARLHYKHTLAEVYRRQAHQYIEKQQGKPALELLQKALNTDTAYIPALKDLAYVQMQMNELHSAKQTYQRVLELEPTSRQALLHLGRIEAKLGNSVEAESHFLSLIKHEPDFMDTYSQLSNLRKASDDLAGAKNALTMGIQRQPAWAPGYWWRGLIYQKQGESDKAEADFRRAIQLAPDVPFPKDALASLLATENRSLDEALALAESTVATDKRPAHIATLALVYYRLRRISDAKRVIQEAYTQSPKHPYIKKIHSEILQTDRK